MTDRSAVDADATGASRLALVGSVTSGLGRGAEFVSLRGYARQFVDRLGYEPFPGTLNVDLDPASVTRRTRLEIRPGVRIESWDDDGTTYGAVTCYPARLVTDEGTVQKRAHVVVPDRTDHDEAELELLAPVELRRRLDLADGDRLLVVAETTTGWHR